MAKKKKMVKKKKPVKAVKKRKRAVKGKPTAEKNPKVKIPTKWKKIIQGIPRFDPVATAEDCWFDVAAAKDALDFFPECLRHVKGEKAGQPFVLGRWEASIIANLFGWKRPDGTRRFREALLLVPRKNGKSTLAAGILLYMLFCDNEAGAEIYSAAAERQQAKLVFDHAKGMIEQEPELNSRATVYTNAIALKDGSAYYKPLSADSYTKHGFNVHLAIIDELHTQKNSDLVDALITGTGARRQPLVLHVTTSDFDRPSVCNQKRDYALKVRDQVIKDKAFLPIIYEIASDDDWTDPRVWKAANPNLGVSISMEYFKREFKRACEIPSYENTFKRFHLNLKTEQDVRWIPLEKWDKCALLDESDFGIVQWFGGLDLASTIDIASFVLYSPDNNCVVPFFWIPADSTFERERRDKVPYETWIREGFITATEGNVIDYDVIRRDINQIAERFNFNIKEIGVDRWGSQHIQTQLDGDGFEVVPFGQGFASMSPAAKELERLIIGGILRHGGHPVLRWMASNVAIEEDAAGNIKPSKKKSTEKIDGIVALIMAIGRATAIENEFGKSVYDERGMKTL